MWTILLEKGHGAAMSAEGQNKMFVQNICT